MMNRQLVELLLVAEVLGVSEPERTVRVVAPRIGSGRRCEERRGGACPRRAA